METHRISESGLDRELLASLRALTRLDTPATIERFETEYPNAIFWATFGQSETSDLAMLSPYRDRPKSAGRPLFWRSTAVVDGDDRAKPAGEIIDFVNGQIARYKRPKHVVLVDKLPRTAGATSIGLLLNQRTGSRRARPLAKKKTSLFRSRNFESPAATTRLGDVCELEAQYQTE